MQMAKSVKLAVRSIFFLAALSLVGLSAGAQNPMTNGHAYSTGDLTQVSASSVTVNGVQAAVDSSTVFVGADGSGNLQKLAWTDFQVGDTASLFTETENGAIVATSVYRGVLFMVQGQVTALQRDGQNKLQSLVIDGAYAIHVSQTTFDYMGTGNMGMGMGGNMSGGMMGGGMMGGGNIQSVTHDMSNNVTGFTMSTSGGTKQCLIDSSTQITRKGQMMGSSALKTGMHVKVTGVTRGDGSVQCSAVQIIGSMM